jgi:VanZ family protein
VAVWALSWIVRKAPLRPRLSSAGTAARRAARLAPSESFRLQGNKICSKFKRFRDANLDQRCDRVRALFLFADLNTILKQPNPIQISMLHRLISIAAWAVLAFIAYATISPIQARPTLPTSTGFEHFTAFAVLGLLFCLAYPRHFALVCLIVLGSAVLLEIMQLLTPDRHGRIQDAIEKMAGGLVGIVVGRAILYFALASRWIQD